MSKLQAIIAYYRVSTKRQGQSGLGLDAQKQAVEQFATQHGCKVLAEYTEVESGKRSDRPKLMQAIAHAKNRKSRLVIAKLDRLSRNVAFLSALMDGGVDFVCCDNPHATRLTVHILAAVAEDEARRISERTKAALEAAKRRGTLLGSSRPGHWDGKERQRLAGLEKGRVESIRTRQRQALEAVSFLEDKVRTLRHGEKATYREIADVLNAEGFTTPRGCAWNFKQVYLMCVRLGITEKGTRSAA